MHVHLGGGNITNSVCKPISEYCTCWVSPGIMSEWHKYGVTKRCVQGSHRTHGPDHKLVTIRGEWLVTRVTCVCVLGGEGGGGGGGGDMLPLACTNCCPQTPLSLVATHWKREVWQT